MTGHRYQLAPLSLTTRKRYLSGVFGTISHIRNISGGIVVRFTPEEPHQSGLPYWDEPMCNLSREDS